MLKHPLPFFIEIPYKQTMTYSFTKMHGLGNDFVIFDARREDIQLSPRLIQRVSDRRFGIGCDQVLLMRAPRNGDADLALEIYNADGTPGGACGNGNRCIAWLNAKGEEASIRIETPDRVVSARVTSIDEVSVDMGKASCQDVDLKIPGIAHAFAVNVGNPHVVLFPEPGAEIDLVETAKNLQHNLLFPQGTNVELVEVVNRKRLNMSVWERGTGLTAACGTGACASAVAAFSSDKIDRDCKVYMPGGHLSIHITDSMQVQMTGAVCLSYTGVLDPSLFE
jgi:diaminopimelate epimerase